MTTAQPLTRQRVDEILRDAVAHQRFIVLTHQGPDGWRLVKCKFVAGSPSAESVIVRLPAAADSDQTVLPEPGEPLGATFRLGHKKCLFSTTIEAVNRDPRGVALTLQWPGQLQQIQRRAFERAQPPKGTVVAVRFWRHERTGRGQRDVRHGQLEDLSCGGMRIKATNPGDVELGKSYRCTISNRTGRSSVVADAILRHREAADQGRASLGFQFVGLEATPEGRETLDRLLRVIHRFKRRRRKPRA